MSLVTIEELNDYLGELPLNDSQERAAQLILDGTQNALEIYLHRTLEQVHVREKLATDYLGEVKTRYTPIQRVLSIKPILANAVIPTVATPIALQDVSAFTDSATLRVIDLQPLQNSIVPGGIYIGIPRSWFLVEYLAGGQQIAAPVLASIKIAILRVATREVTALFDDTVGVKADSNEEPSNAQKIDKGWQDSELKMFDSLRRRVIR